jgi:NAD(P)-dependent dehydrogenase (short-subunit alcohol dehydrogenase family)
VVTGAAQTIGRAIVEEFVREGARPAIVDLNAEGAERYAAELRGRGVDALGVECDVAERASVVAAAERVADGLGPRDVLVNNAGIALMGPSHDFPEEQWRRSLEVMATDVFFCRQAFGRQMIEGGGGVIVNISSMNATMAFPIRLARAARSIAKAGSFSPRTRTRAL